MKKIGFIGMGNMAGAIMHGLIQSGFLSGDEMLAYDIVDQQLEKARAQGLCVAGSEEDVVRNCELLILAVKPQVVESVLERLKESLKGKAIVSIVLGYDFLKFQEHLDKSTRHLSIMPNTPVFVLEGMTLLEDVHSLSEAEFLFVKELFTSLGKVEVVPSHLMGVAGTLSGCGPAFLYIVIEALADGAVKEGLPRDVAYRLASQTVLGAGAMQGQTQVHPGVLKDNVCSPGGSTIKGVEALEMKKVRAAFIEAISAAVHYK